MKSLSTSKLESNCDNQDLTRLNGIIISEAIEWVDKQIYPKPTGFRI